MFRTVSRNLFYLLAVLFIAACCVTLALIPFEEPLYNFLAMGLLVILATAPLFLDVRKALFYIMVAILPLSLGKYYVYPGQANVWIGWQVIDILLLALYVLWIFEKKPPKSQWHRFKAADPVFPLIALVILSFLSGINAADKPVWIYQSWLLLRGFMIFFYVAHHSELKEGSLFVIVWILLGQGVFQSLVGLAQWSIGGPVGLKILGEPEIVRQQVLNIQTVFRVTGTFPSDNMVWFMYMDLILPVLFALVISRTVSGLKKTVLFPAMMFIFFVSSLSFTRMGWVCFAMAASIILVFTLLREKFHPVMLLKTFVIVVVFFILISVIWEYVVARFESYDLGSAAMRIPLMQNAWNIISTHPLLGIGAGNYILVMYLFDVSDQGIASFFLYPVHNLYLFVAAEMGIFSLIAFLAFLARILAAAWRECEKRSDSLKNAMLLGFFAGLCAFAVHGQIESMALGRLTMLWFVSGIIMNLCLKRKELETVGSDTHI